MIKIKAISTIQYNVKEICHFILQVSLHNLKASSIDLSKMNRSTNFEISHMSHVAKTPDLYANPLKFHPRRLKLGLSDKLNLKSKYRNNQFKREEKIKRSLERERIKAHIGFRIRVCIISKLFFRTTFWLIY